jgi:hypothetical protein
MLVKEVAPAKTLVFLIFCFASAAFADDFKTVEGKEYKNVKVSRVEPDGSVLTSKSGISKVYFTELPKEVQERFHYDPEKAAEFTAQTKEGIDLLLRQRTEEAQRRAEERAKYWGEQAQARSQQEAAEQQREAQISNGQLE